MKKVLSFVISVLVLISLISPAFVALPTSEELFGTFMPSLALALDKEC